MINIFFISIGPIENISDSKVNCYFFMCNVNEKVIAYFPILAPNAPIIAQQQKKPIDNQGVLVGLRSVADSNRRKRFCRPLPSHSVNRPYTFIKKTYKQLQTLNRWRIARLTPRELLHFVASVVRLAPLPIPTKTLNRPCPS